MDRSGDRIKSLDWLSAQSCLLMLRRMPCQLLHSIDSNGKRMNICLEKSCSINKLMFETSNFSNPLSKHVTDVDNRHFNHGIDIIFPDKDNISLLLKKWPGKDFIYYKLSNLSLAHLLEIDFLQAFVKKGQMYLMSVEVKVDIHDCLILLPTGKLILNITKDLYNGLGIQGQPSHFSDLKKEKYVVEIDLISPSFVPGSKMFERIKSCFKRRADLSFTSLIYWKPYDINICSSSIASYFESKNLQVIPCFPSNYATTISTPLPIIKSDQWEGNGEYCNYSLLLEWAGGIACGIERSHDMFPISPKIADQLSLLQWRGFFPSCQLAPLLEELISTCSNKENSLPWIILAIHGFQDCVATRNYKEHNYLKNGDNILTYVIFPNGDYWKYTVLSTFDSI